MAFQRTLDELGGDFFPQDFVYGAPAPSSSSRALLQDLLPKHRFPSPPASSPKTSFGDDAGGEGKDDAGKEGEKADAGGGKAEKQDAGGGGSSKAPGGGPTADAKQAEANEKKIEQDPVFINMKEMLGVVKRVKNSLSTMDDALKDEFESCIKAQTSSTTL